MTLFHTLLVLASSSVIAATTTAAAQPAASRCQVGVSRAPDEVRAAIAQWVNAEPRCSTSLDVRVIATEGGYYVIAHSGNGRVFERVVPDAQAVGVLVASWAADDSAVAPSPPVAVPDPAPPIPSTIVPPASDPGAGFALRPPSAVAPRSLDPVHATDAGAIPAKQAERRWLALGAMAQISADDATDTASGSRGIRADLDLYRKHGISVGAGFALMQTNLILQGYSSPYGYIDTDDVRVLGSVAYTHRTGKWAVRFSGGLGFVYTSGNGQFDGMTVSAEGAFPTFEAAVVVTRDLTKNWGVLAGPVLTAYQQDYVFTSGGSTFSFNRSDEVSLYIALLRRL